jgi:hypothetical protein
MVVPLVPPILYGVREMEVGGAELGVALYIARVDVMSGRLITHRTSAANRVFLAIDLVLN